MLTSIYKIKAIDQVSSIFRNIGGLNVRTTKGVDKLNNRLKLTSTQGGRSVDRLRNHFTRLESRVMKVPGRIYKGFRKMANKLGPIGSTIAGVFAVHKIVDFAKASINAASDLQESMSKAHVTFGENFSDVQKFANGARDSIGMSKAATFEAASGYAALFKNIGAGSSDVAKMSESSTRLAADLASFHNMEPAVAVQALMSTLKGETEPALRFGILMDDASLKQKAFSMGLINTTKGVLPKAIKMQAIYATVMDQTKDAHGDFARTSTGFANRQRILAAGWTNLSARIGEVFLPYAEKVQAWGIRALDWISANEKKIKGWGMQIFTAAKYLGGFLLIAKGILLPIQLFTSIAGPIMKMAKFLKLGKIAMIEFNLVARINPFAWIGLAIGGIILIYKNWDWVKSKIMPIWDFFVTNPFNWMIEVVDKYIPGFAKAFDLMWTIVKSKFTSGVQWIKDLIEDAAAFLNIDFKFGVETDLSNLPKGGRRNILKTGDEKTDYTQLPDFSSFAANKQLTKDKAKTPIKDRMASMVAGGGKEIKNITISIGKLVESLNITSETIHMSEAEIKKQMTRVLLSVVNDTNY